MAETPTDPAWWHRSNDGNEDKDSIILRLRVELATERASRKEIAILSMAGSRERARTEHALERALVDERVHALELRALKVKLEKEKWKI